MISSDTPRPGARGTIVTLVRLSRWRFWLYLAGPYLVGCAAGIPALRELNRLWFWGHLVFFLFPANLMLYGLNDLFDTETDSRNPKKGSVEHKLRHSEHNVAVIAVAAALLTAIVVAAVQHTREASITMTVFTALAVFYSAPPIRFKARPILDSASNVLYALPGFLGYIQAGGSSVPAGAVVVAGLWTAAMHLFSAIPDIESDRSAAVHTTATLLGFRKSLAACAILWTAFAATVVLQASLWPWSLAAVIYPGIGLTLLFLNRDAIYRFYWRFPLINAGSGMFAFFVLALSK
ncbi:MAG: prenyltransferase [Armatimonadota bacterium]